MGSQRRNRLFVFVFERMRRMRGIKLTGTFDGQHTRNACKMKRSIRNHTQNCERSVQCFSTEGQQSPPPGRLYSRVGHYLQFIYVTFFSYSKCSFDFLLACHATDKSITRKPQTHCNRNYTVNVACKWLKRDWAE